MSEWPQMVIIMDHKNDTALEKILEKCADFSTVMDRRLIRVIIRAY